MDVWSREEKKALNITRNVISGDEGAGTFLIGHVSRRFQSSVEWSLIERVY